MGLLPGLPQGKPTGNAAPEAASEGAAPDAAKYLSDDQANVTPEEQAEYEQAMNNALELLYTDKGVRPELLEQLKAGGGAVEAAASPDQPNASGNGPILALAQAAVTIVGQLDDSAREAGKPISDDVLYHVGADVTAEIAEIAEASKIHDYSEEDITGAFMQALDMYRDKAIADGRTSKETLEGQFNEINQAEAAGKLGDILPGLGGGQTVGEAPVQAQQG